jgi:small neutral amino acid transporter SnatA (MarC family)
MVDYAAVFDRFVAVIDPVRTSPVFIAITRRDSYRDKTRMAFKAAAVATVFLGAFVVSIRLLIDADVVGVPGVGNNTTRFGAAWPGILIFVSALETALVQGVSA